MHIQASATQNSDNSFFNFAETAVKPTRSLKIKSPKPFYIESNPQFRQFLRTELEMAIGWKRADIHILMKRPIAKQGGLPYGC